jgi:large subunit ribosomal protein L4
VLLLTGQPDAVLYKSGRNLARLSVQEAASASTLDLLGAQVLVLQEGALARLTSLLADI